ncbi:ABC transporter permease [marine bacterium AO1-C]|nr:ABC transporter permease [marine bacterium AO1-C]
MRTIRFILRKEMLQIFRNKAMLPIIFVMPIMQLLLLSQAMTYELNEIRVHLVDLDHSPTSRHLWQKLQASPYFSLTRQSQSIKQGEYDLLTNDADLVLVIPQHMEKQLFNQRFQKIQLLINAINASKAGLVNAYANSVLQDFNQNIQSEFTQVKLSPQGPAKPTTARQIKLTSTNWFNPELDYQTYMVPGLLVALVTMIGAFLSSMNIVKEKEIGTIEQLNVTPIRKHQFIIGKLLPFVFIGIFELVFGLLLGFYVFDIPMVGSPWLIFAFSLVYLMVILGLGLLISTMVDTQQQAMFIAWFILIIFILMSGLFTAIESMPAWAQQITRFNPIRYFNEVMRMVMLKGSGFGEIKQHFIILTVYALAVMSLALLRYRKTT